MNGSSVQPEPLRLLVAGEDRAHRQVSELLIDRRLVEKIDWVDVDVVGHVREWLGDGGRDWLPIKNAYRRARDAKLPVWGHFQGLPQRSEAPQWRAVLLLAANRQVRPHAVILARDVDGHIQRVAGMKQAVESGWPFAVIIMAAQPEIEAWIVAGFQPANDAEQEAHERLRREVSFDPVLSPHRLGSKGGPRDAKRVTEALGIDAARKEECLSAPFELLLQRAGEAGLGTFLEGVDTHIVERIAQRPSR
jgi:hypothetical protein